LIEANIEQLVSWIGSKSYQW